MADDRIEVVFGAEFSDLVDGVDRVRTEITSLAASVAQVDDGFRSEFEQVQAPAQQAADKVGSAWKGALVLIDTGLDTMLKGVLTGTQTWQQAMDRLFSDLAVSFIEQVAKMMVQWAAFEITTQGLGMTGLVANPLLPTAGGIGGFLGGLMGFDAGAWSIPQDMVAVVHAGEMVLPADVASTARAGGAVPGYASGGASSAGAGAVAAGPGVTLNVSVQAMDATGVAAWANANARTLATTIARYMGNNPSSRGDF